MENNCHTPDLLHTFPYVENGELNLVLKLAKPLTLITTCMGSYIVTNLEDETTCKHYKKSNLPSTFLC